MVEARDVLDRCSLDTLLDGVETAADCALALSDGGCRAGPGTAPASAWPPTARPLVYVCGPTDFVETAASALVVLRPEAGRMARTLRRDRRFGMTRLDRNAIAGELFDIFGEEMTTATGTCAGCGATRPLGELAVYRQAPELSLGVAAARTCCW